MPGNFWLLPSLWSDRWLARRGNVCFLPQRGRLATECLRALPGWGAMAITVHSTLNCLAKAFLFSLMHADQWWNGKNLSPPLTQPNSNDRKHSVQNSLQTPLLSYSCLALQHVASNNHLLILESIRLSPRALNLYFWVFLNLTLVQLAYSFYSHFTVVGYFAVLCALQLWVLKRNVKLNLVLAAVSAIGDGEGLGQQWLLNLFCWDLQLVQVLVI